METSNREQLTASARLEQHLAERMKAPDLTQGVDMNDQGELSLLEACPKLQAALRWLDERLYPMWKAADSEALRSQRRHWLLARVSICAGVGAIVVAIVQLALQQSWRQWLGLTVVLEVLAASAGLIAVAVGLTAKFNRRWLCQRHRAERLRMLKFQALGRPELWCDDSSVWEDWVESQLKKLENTRSFQEVEQWSTEGEIEPETTVSPACQISPEQVQALATYYRFKRIDYQAAYFQRRNLDYQGRTSRWRHLSLPVFFISVAFVLTRFGAEFIASQYDGGTPSHERHHWEILSLWCAAAAASIPVLGLGVRAWFSVFELPRSASLFAAKQQALIRASSQLRRDSCNPAATLSHIALNEHFLEGEHREWLRLLLEAEWFL
jgi:hypothetical protein